MAPGGEAFDPALIVFGALAIFIIWKLRSVLGVRIDREGPPQTRFEPHQPMARESARIFICARRHVRRSARRGSDMARCG